MTEALTSKGRARLVPELSVTDIARSLTFWRDILGFRVLYDRPEEGFAYLDLDGAEVMLDQRDGGPVARRGIWETGPMQHPFGRGINFEIQVCDLTPVAARLAAARWPIFFGPEERWYRSGTQELGVRQLLIQDPDGYLVRLQQEIGERPVA